MQAGGRGQQADTGSWWIRSGLNPLRRQETEQLLREGGEEREEGREEKGEREELKVGGRGRARYLVTPQVEHHQVGEQGQLRRENRQVVEGQVQLLQLQQLTQLIRKFLQKPGGGSETLHIRVPPQERGSSPSFWTR